MEPTQALNFNIPKLKRQVTKDNLFEIDSNSRDAKELLDNVARTYLDQKYNCPWKVKAIQMVRNTDLEQEYKTKRADMKEEGRHSRELVDQIAFCAIKEPSYITKIAKNGMMTKNLPFSIIGEHKSGVYLTKHADVQLKMVETISSQTITALFVFNAMLGKGKAINERVLSSAEPTPNYDCHIPLQPAQPSDPHVVQLQRSQIYLYEYDNDGMPAPRPRHCLPHAVITYEKFDNYTVGPLKSIFSYDPNKSSSQTKKGEDKPDWKKTPRNMTNAQLSFPKTSLLDKQIRPLLPFGSWPATSLMPGGSAPGILGPMTPAPGPADGPTHDLEHGILASKLLLNYAQQIAGVDGQGVVVHRSGSDPRKRFHNDEPASVSEQQRILPPQQSQTFPNIRPGCPGVSDYQYSNDRQNMDNVSGWEPKAPHGFYSECDPTDNTKPPWQQSGPYNNNNNNNNNFNNNNFNNNNNSNNVSNNNNSNNVGNNRCGLFSWLDQGSSSFEADDQKKLKPANTNCDTKTTNNTKNKSSTSKNVSKKSIPFALNKKKSTPAGTDAASSQQKTKDKDDQNGKKEDSSSAESGSKAAKSVNNSCQKKDPNSTEMDSKQKPKAKVQETATKSIPFPKKGSSAPLVSEELSKSVPNLQDMQDLFNKLFQAECKDSIGTSSLGGKSSEKGKNTKSATKAKGSTAGQLPDKAFSVHNVPESDLKTLQDFIKDKIKTTKENEKKASKNNQPKIKTTLTSLKQGLKTTILLPTPGKNNNEENGPKLEDLTKLLNVVDLAIAQKTQSEAGPPKWEDNYQSFLKTVQKMDLTPGQHHKRVRKKEPPPEPPPPDKIPPPVAEVSIDDVVNTKLMKELLLEQDFSESTSVSEADSLYLPPAERKKRKTNSIATRRQTKKKAPFDMTSYRRRRKRQKMQRKAAAEFDTSSIASTTSSFGFGDHSQNIWESDFKEFEMETALPPDGKEMTSLDPMLSSDKQMMGAEPVLSYGKELMSREPTLKDFGFNSWKDATISLKFQPVVVLKDCVQQITSHLHEGGGSNVMEWIGSQKELLETLNLPPDHSSVVSSSGSGPKATNQARAAATTTTSKISQKTKSSKTSTMDYHSTNQTISINSIKASVRSEINKIKKMSSKKNIPSGTGKKKISKPKAPPMEIPRIKAKLPEKSSVPSTKPDRSPQLFSSISKDIKKPTPASTAPSPSSLTLPSKTTLSSANTLQSKTTHSSVNKTITPKGIIKNVRSDSAAPKASAVSPATFPATDQSLKVDLLMEIISAPPAMTSAASEAAEQRRLAEQKKAAEQKKQKISFQAYMEKHVKPKPVKSPPREKTNVFEAFKEFLSPEKDPGPKPVSEPPFISTPTTTPLLEKLKPSLVMPPAVTTPTITPLLEKLKPALVMPPSVGAFANSLFSPLSPPPPISRDPRIPSILSLPFPKDPPLPKIIPTIPKPAKEDLKPILKDKAVKPISHKKAPLQKTVPIPLDDPKEPSLTLVDPRLSRKPASSQPDFHPVKEPLPKPLNDPSLPRDPRLLRMYSEYQSDGVVGNKIGKTQTQDTSADLYNPVKLKSGVTEGVSDVIGKSKPLIKNNTWNLCAIYTGDDVPQPPRRPLSTNEEHSLNKSSSRPRPATQTGDIPVYAQKIFSKDVSKGMKPSKVSSDNKTEEMAKLDTAKLDLVQLVSEKLDPTKSVLTNSEPEKSVLTKSEPEKSESAKSESTKSESQEASIDRQAWGFYREMSPKRPGSEDPNATSDSDFNPLVINEKSDENSCSDMDIATPPHVPQYFSNSDSDSNLIGEDLSKPLYIDMSASATPRRDSFESYKFSLKSPEQGFKKSDFPMNPRVSAGMDLNEKTVGFKNTLVPSVCASTENIGTNIFGANPNTGSSENAEEKLSPFNETVAPADPESTNSSASSLFCAYQMEGEAKLNDTSHIWMKSLSNLSKVKAVSAVNISDELFDVLRKVVKENIPAGQKDMPQGTSFPTLSSTKGTGGRIPDKDLYKPGTLDKDYKLGGLDKDLFKSSSLDGGLFTAEDSHKEHFKSESVDNNFGKSESLNRLGASRNEVSNDEKLMTTSQSQLGTSSSDIAESKSYSSKTEMYSPTHPTMDETSEKPAAESATYSKSEEFVQGQAIPVLNFSRQKQPSKKSRSLSPTTTVPSPTQYLPTSSGWMAPQQPPPFWPDWRNMPPFNPVMTTSLLTPPIWPPPINVAPTHLGNIPFPPPGYINPGLAQYHTIQPDPTRSSNVYDWFADKINSKGETSNNENNAPKINKDPHVNLVSNFLNVLSKPDNTSDADSPSIPSAPTKEPSFKSVSGSSSAETKSNLENAQIPKSESFVELTSINTNQENSNSKADSEKSRSSSYSPTDKTSEIVSISASDPSMSPGHLDSGKTPEKGAFFKLKRTVSISSSLSSESCSRFSKMDSLEKIVEKPSKSDLPTFLAASPSSNDDSEGDVWHKKITSKEVKNKTEPSVLNAEKNSSSLEPSLSTPVSELAPGQQDADTSFSENNDSATNEDVKRKKRESSEERTNSKGRTKGRHKREKKKSGHSPDIPKSVQISTINSKSLKDIKLAQKNRELLQKLAEQFSEKKGKSDLQNLLESVKKIKKELASHSSDEKGGSAEKSGRKSLPSPRHGSEEKDSSSRPRKSEKEEMGWSEKNWKPIKSVEVDCSASVASISSTSTNSTSNKSSCKKEKNSKKQNTEVSTSKTSENTQKEASKEHVDKEVKPSKEDKNYDSELEEGELPDEESGSSGEENVSADYPKHRSSRRRSESLRQKRRPDRRHSSVPRSYKRRKRERESKKDEGMPPRESETYPYDRMDSYPRGSPDRYPHDRKESYQHSRMECYPMNEPEGYTGNRMDYHPNDKHEGQPTNRIDYHPIDNPDGHPGDRRDHQHDGPEDCPPDTPGFYPPNRMDNYNNGKPDNFIQGKRKRSHGKPGRFSGKNASHPHDKSGGHFQEESNNYPDKNFNDYDPDDDRDRYPWGRSDSYPYGNPDGYAQEKYRPSLDPDDYIQDERDGLLYEKSDDCIPFKKGFSHNWPDNRHPRGRRGGSYSPGREEVYPNDGRFIGNGSPPRDGRFLGNGSPPRDSRFLGNGSPPRDIRFIGNGSPPRDGRFLGNGSPPRDSRFLGNGSPPRDIRFIGNGSPPRDGRFIGNGSPPRDGRFIGNGSPPREEGLLHQGRYPPDNWTNASHFREIKIEAKNNCLGNKGQKGIGQSVSGGNHAAGTQMGQKEGMMSGGPVSYGNPHTQTGPGQPPANHPEEDDKKVMITFDSIDSYLKMFANEGSREYRILKKALGVPLETSFNSLSKTKRKKIRKKIQSQLQALQQAPTIGNNEGSPPEADPTYSQAPKRLSFQIEDFQNFSSFDGNPNSMEHLKNWLNQRPDEDQFLPSRSLSEARDDSEDEANPPGCADDNPEFLAIADPKIRRAVRMVSWNEKSPGFGTPHQRIQQKLLLAEEKDDLFSFEGCFLILMRKIPRIAVERLATLREVLNFLTCELQAAKKANDAQKFHKLQATKNKLHERRKGVLEKFTGTISPQRLQTIKEAKNIYVDCLEYLKRRPDPLPKVDKEFVVKTIKAIQGHISMTKKFLDEQQASNNPAPPPLMSSLAFCPDRQGPHRSAQDTGWSWFGPRNMDQQMPGCYNQPRNNGPF